MVFGAADHTRIVGQRYLHESSRTGLEIPEGWQTNLNSKILQLVSPGEDAVIQVSGKRHLAGTSAKTYLDQLLLAGALIHEEKLIGENLEGWMATSIKQTKDGEIRIWLATWINDDIVLMVVASTLEPQKYSKIIEACIRSFFRLGEVELSLTQPFRIELLKVEPGVTYSQIASDSPLGENVEEQLRLINGQIDLKEEPRVGSWIKIIR